MENGAGESPDENPPQTSSEFTKPDEWEEPDSPLDGGMSEPDVAQPGSFRMRMSVVGRQYMRPNEGNFWLYQGERAIFDIAARIDSTGEFDVSSRHFLYVLVDFQPVPFQLTPVDETAAQPFPEQEAITGEVDTADRQVIDLQFGRPHGFTIVIPPESFGDAAARDVRFLVVSDEEPAPENVIKTSHTHSHGVVVNYGSEVFDRDAAKHLDAELVTPEEAYAPLVLLGQLFLHPPASFHDPSQFDVPEREARFGQLFETDQEVVPLTAYVTGHLNEERPFYVATLEDRQFDGPHGLVTPPSRPRDLSRPYAARFDVQARLEDDQVHAYQLLRFSKPFERQPYGGVISSDTIFLKKTP